MITRLFVPSCGITGLVAVALLAPLATPTQAQLLYDFESGLDGFVEWTFSDGGYINHQQSTDGVTQGTMALEVEGMSGFSREVVVSHGPGAEYDIFNAVAADPSAYTFDFDLSFTEDSWTGLQDIGTWFTINVFSNSDGGFKEEFNVASGTPGAASSVPVSLPASDISLAIDSSFFQLGFGSNSNSTDGLGGEGAKYYIDNVRFTPILDPPVIVEDLLFSWETPDNPGTPGVNEQLEGWTNGFNDASYQHTRTIESIGATDGGSSLGVDFTVPFPGMDNSANFAWGSQFALDSGQGEGEPVDPVVQAEIDDLIDRVNQADSIAFDVTFPDDQFPNFPSYLSLFLSISDSSGNFYQSSAIQAGNPVNQAEDTITLEVPLSDFSGGGTDLGQTDLQDGTFFRIALATNSNDSNLFYLDNFRLLTTLTELDGDYNNDGVVDAADYTVWRDNVGQPEGTLLNDPNSGVIGNDQYNTWVSQYGATASSSAVAVPEPASVVLALGLLAAPLGRRRG